MPEIMTFPEETATSILTIINQVYELEKKLGRMEEGASPMRNLLRIRRSLEAMGYHYHDPKGEAYDLTRTDCEASLSGEKKEGLSIREVIKPIVYFRQEGISQIVQKGVVIVG